jgi:plasmid stability protein
MASLTIRQLDEQTKRKLRVRAARHGRSMESEAREIIRQTLAADDDPTAGMNLLEAIRYYIDPVGGIDLDIPPREPVREPPKF